MKRTFIPLLFIGILGLSSASADAQSCDCHDYLYLNEPLNGMVEKFRIENDSTLTHVAIPFLSGIGSPHGLGMDQNGFIYIGSLTTQEVFRYTCDGTLVNTLPFTISQTNTVVVGNLLFTTFNSSNVVSCFDICTGTLIGELDFAGIDASWGLAQGEDGNLYVAGGQSGPVIVYQFPPDPALFTTPTPTLYSTPYFTTDPGITCGNNTGLDVDEFGNVYIACVTDNTVYKVDPSGTILATSTDNMDGNGGHFGSFGIVYSDATQQLYLSNPLDDCIAVLDASDLTYRSDLSVPANGVNQGKGIGLLTECCPTATPIIINETVCAASGDEFYLADLLDCEGLCASAAADGGWVRVSGTGGSFDPCDLSFAVDPTTTSSCFTFNGGGGAIGCTAYQYDVCFDIVEMTDPVAVGDQTICVNGNTENIEVSILSSGITGITYQWQQSTIGCLGFIDIPGATGTVYHPGLLTETTYFRAVASSTDAINCTSVSNCVIVTLDENCTAPLTPCEDPQCDPVPSATVCEDGSEAVTLSCDPGVMNVIWYNGSGDLVGTDCDLVIDNSMIGNGTVGESQCFYYTADDANSCEANSCCPVLVTVELCCPPVQCIEDEFVINKN